MNKIDRFGVEAILGRRTLYFGELRRMIHAENIATAYHLRLQASNIVDWARDNPMLKKILDEAESLCRTQE